MELTNGTCPSSVKDKKEEVKYFCGICNSYMSADVFCFHHLSAEHLQKAVPNMKPKYCVSVTGFRPDTAKDTLYKYFCLFGKIKAIVIHNDKEVYAVVEFYTKCSVGHVVECLMPHVIDRVKVSVQRGRVPVEDELSEVEIPVPEKVHSVFERGKKLKSYTRTICDETFDIGEHREHHLSRAHTRHAVPFIRPKCCVVVTGFHHETTKADLYDYFCIFERIRTISMPKKKGDPAFVEFERKHPLTHILSPLVTHKFGKQEITVEECKSLPPALCRVVQQYENHCGAGKNFPRHWKKILIAPLPLMLRKLILLRIVKKQNTS